MYEDTVHDAIRIARGKRAFLYQNPLGYMVSSMLAGVYVGLGIILIFAVGGPLAEAGHPALRLIMGASFGIALTLVVFAGAELFTGNTLYMMLGRLRGGIQTRDLALVWAASWVGNLAGALALSVAVVHVGTLRHALPLIGSVSMAKTTATPLVLVLSGLLCNLLVCLALWTAGRTRSDAAKILLICLCLFAFIGSGFEHSVANMTLLSVHVLAQTGAGGSWAGLFHNLLWVTIGNILGGSVVLAGAYHLIADKQTAPDTGRP